MIINIFNVCKIVSFHKTTKHLQKLQIHLMIVYTKTKPLVHVCIYSTFFVSIIITVICNIIYD